MSRDVKAYLEDIITCANHALDYTAGVTFDAFVNNQEKYDAVVRNLEIIGEAAKHVPESTREQYPDVPWREMARFRDVLAHVYFGLRPETIWDVVQNELPELVSTLKEILALES